MTDRMIRRFQMEAEVLDDSKFIQTQQTFRTFLINQMMDEGFTPLLDIDPVWKTSYIADSQTYQVVYTMQAVYVGEVAWQSEGVIGTKIIPRNTQRNKSLES